MPEEPSEQKNALLAGAGRRQLFRSRERHGWYAGEGYGGINAIQGPTLM